MGGDGGRSQFFFPDISHFFQNMKNFGQKKAILKTFFTQEKGNLLPEKGHLPKLGGGGGLAPPVPTPLKSDIKKSVINREINVY